MEDDPKSCGMLGYGIPMYDCDACSGCKYEMVCSELLNITLSKDFKQFIIK